MTWNERYGQDEYAYGTEPNEFLASFRLTTDIPKKILCIAEGEGRNAVYLARQGFDVTAIDQSESGMKKASKLAALNNVTIETIVADLGTYKIIPEKYDGIISIFGHFENTLRSKIHGEVLKGIKKGGFLILEAYSKEQLDYSTGGPKTLDFLYSLDELEADFGESLEYFIKKRTVRPILEGKYHTGSGSVIQLFALKN